MEPQPGRLFPVPDTPDPESYISRLTQRRAQQLAAGRHPATGRQLLRLVDPPQRAMCCGDCAHAGQVTIESGRKFWKCAKRGHTSGPATDIRISWPACDLFERDDPSARGIQRRRYQETTTNA